eukprot:SAG31_NODE_371_length_16628_cov_3.741943_11_plen_313_part_00
MDNDFIVALARAALGSGSSCTTVLTTVEKHSAQAEPAAVDQSEAEEHTMSDDKKFTRLEFAVQEPKQGRPAMLLIQQDRRLGVGGVLWQASLALSLALQQQRPVGTECVADVEIGGMASFLPYVHNIEGQTVLELGCGPGLVGLTAWCRGASKVVMSDLPGLQHMVEANIARAGATVDRRVVAEPRWCALDWRAGIPSELVDTAGFDCILGSDITYNEELHAPLLSTLRCLCRPGSQTTIILAHQRRPQAQSAASSTEALFTKRAYESGFITSSSVAVMVPAEFGIGVARIDEPVVLMQLRRSGAEPSDADD